ncbi:MAG: WbuC family cupin fold metalloprotein [Gammaproteobacteria bacterium]|nr:WbuC family cupin fold metalloprotein [Gammaproteobacteria bacterium]
MKILTQALLDELVARAAAAPRGRAHHNIHASAEDPLQRFCVAAQRHSYFRPHRHHTCVELGTVLRGGFDVLTFDDSGCVTARWSVGEGSGNVAFETPRLTWHTLLARRDGSVFLETKPGPYDPVTAAEFAAWAPPEGDVTVPALLDWLRDAQPGARWGGPGTPLT